MKRGEIWTVAGSGRDCIGRPRPAVIVQDDGFSKTASVSVCPLTTFGPATERARQLIEPTAGNGLESTSKLMVDKITTLPRCRLGKRLGCPEDAEIYRLDRALVIFLGLVPTLETGRAGENT